MIQMENLKSFKMKSLLAILFMVFAGQSAWAVITPTMALTDKSNNGNAPLADGGTLSATYYPNWVGFEKPTVALYTEEGGVRTSQASKYQITYYIDGHEGDTSFSTDINGNQITTDATTATTITRFFGDVKIGSSTGTVTVRVVAKVKDAYAAEYAETVSQTYKITINSVTPTVSASPAAINLKVRQVSLTEDEYNHTWAYRNEATKVALPIPSISVTQNGRTQDLSEYYDITYAPKPSDGSSDKIYITSTNNSARDGYAIYLSAKLAGTDSIGSGLAAAEDAVKPYHTTAGNANLTITFTPKTEYASTYSATTLDVPVTINFQTAKATATLSMRHPLTGELMAAGDTLHYVKYGRNNYLHPYPIPVVIGSDGADLSKHQHLAVKLFAVKDSTYYDRCERPETNPNGPVIEAGLSTGTLHVSTGPESYNLSGNASQLQTGHPGLLKIGMVVVAEHYQGDGNGIEAWYEFTTRRPFEHTKTGYEEHDTEYKCLTDTTYFYVDVMKRSPRLVFNPDPSTVTISSSDVITFNNRFELSGVIGDENDGVAGELVYDAAWAGSSTFWYSFEFPADAGVEIYNWPHWDRMVALDANGDVIAPAGYDWDKNGQPYWSAADSARIASYKYWSVKGWGTDNLWSMKFSKTSTTYGGNIPLKYTIWPWNHSIWDIGEEQIFYYHVEEGRTPTLHVDPTELVASISQAGFAEPEVWVTDNLGQEVSKDFNFTFTIGADPSSTGTTVANSEGNTFQHEVTIGNSAGDVTVHVVAEAKSTELGYTTTTLTGDYVIHILESSPLYEIISTKTDATAVRNFGNTGTTDYDYATDSIMGKMHFIGTGRIYAGYTIAGIPGLNLRFGTFDGSSWEVKADTSEDIGSYDNGNDITDGVAGKGIKFITDDTPVVLNEDSIAIGGSFYELYAHTNGFLTVDARWQAAHTYVLIDYDYPELRQEFTPAADTKGDHTFTMPLREDHSYHLYCRTGGQINMHGLSFQPAFINSNSDTAPVTTGSAFLNGLPTVPTLASATIPEVTYSSDDTSIAEVNANTGAVTPKALSYEGVNIRGKVVSQTDANTFKWPYYKLVVADIPTYRLGDGLDISGSELDKETFAGEAGQKVTTYNIPTPIRMTYGGWQNGYTLVKMNGSTESISSDTWENKGKYGVAGFTSDDHQFNKFIDGFSWSNVCKQNPSDENGKMDYRNYLTGADNMSKERDGYYMNTFTLPAHGAYWRFEPRTSGYLFVYLVQNGVCSYTGDPHSLLNTSKNYERLMWQPLYVVDETGAPITTDVSYENDENMSAGVKNFLGEHATYTEGLIRCGKDDADVQANTNLTSESNSGTVFQWEKDKDGVPTGFDADYKGEDASALKTSIINAWTGAGDSQTIFKDNECNGYALISKTYVRYAVRVKAGKSYWVFQNNSKPQFSGFAFVPDGFDGQAANNNGPAPKNVIISDDDDQATDQIINGTFTDFDVPCNVTYKARSFKNKTWTSLCLPFAVSEYNFKKVFGKNAKIVTYEKLTKNNTNIHFIQHNYRMMEAGRPYFIYPDFDEAAAIEAGKKDEIVFDSVTIERVNSAVIPAASDVTNNAHKEKIFESDGFQFVSSTGYNTCYMPMFSYFMSDAGALKRVGRYYPGTQTERTEGLPIGRYRAYLKNPTSNESFARIGMSNFEEPYEDVPADQQHTVTSIAGVTDGSIYDSLGSMVMKGIFTIDGKRVSSNANDAGNLPAGVYIIDGQKKVIK